MSNDSFHAYTFDAEGNIIAVDAGETATYVYNALNQRVQTVISGTTTGYVFNSAGQRVSEWNWNGTAYAQLKGKYYMGATPVGYYTTASSGAGAATHFEHQDWLGTERLRTTYNGSVEGSFTSLPFGDGPATTGADTDASHYATLDHDTESDTDHAQFRQYSNQQGRFLSPDSYGGSYDAGNPQSFNRYVYAMNNPLGAIDPSGLDEDGEGQLCPDGSMDCFPGGDGGDDYDASFGGSEPMSSTWVPCGSSICLIGDHDGEVICTSNGCVQWHSSCQCWGAISTPNTGFSSTPNPNPGGPEDFQSPINPLGYESGGATGSGGGGGGVGSDGPSYTRQDICAASALLHNGGSTALDAVGIIPGGNVIKGIQAGAGLISAGQAVFGNSTPTSAALAFGGLGLSLVDTLKTIGGTAGKVIPIAGNILSGYSTYLDIKEMNAYYNACMAGQN